MTWVRGAWADLAYETMLINKQKVARYWTGTYSSRGGRASHSVPPRMTVLMMKRAAIFMPALSRIFFDDTFGFGDIGIGAEP